MHRTAIDDVDPTALGDGGVRRELAASLGATDVAINRYRIAPGEGLTGGLHAHLDQEEVFLVLDGAATFETWVPLRDAESASGQTASETVGDPAGDAGEVVVEAGEAIRFAPGEFQSGRNDGETDLVVLALGAPPDTEDVRLPLSCPECGHPNLRLDTGGDRLTFVCPDCDANHVPAACPECGGEALQATLGEEDRPVVVCRDCRARFAEPPLRE